MIYQSINASHILYTYFSRSDTTLCNEIPFPCLRHDKVHHSSESRSISPSVLASTSHSLHPCRCLCFAFFEQMMYTYPFRLTLCSTPMSASIPTVTILNRRTLHPSHSFLTLLRTFIPLEMPCASACVGTSSGLLDSVPSLS